MVETYSAKWYSDSLHQSVWSAQEGDQSAVSELLDAFTPLLKSIARKYRSSVDDAFQEACLAFLRGIAEYDARLGIPFPGYIRRKVHGDVRSAMRRLWRFTERSLSADSGFREENGQLSLWNDLSLRCPDSDRDFAQVDLELWLGEVPLSGRERLSVAAALQGLSCSEVAESMGVSVESVKTWRKRAFKKLRSALTQ